MKFIIGQKLNMTQIFDEKGFVTPVTAISIDSNIVTKIKNVESDGYNAVQIAYGKQKESRMNKAQLGANKGLTFKLLKEFRLKESENLEIGQEINSNIFNQGDSITVSAISKSKGFQGVVKRYNFKGGPRSHGQKHSEREPGSIGGGPGRAGGRVVKGMRMAGRTGGDTVTVKGLRVVSVDENANIIYISGAVPGRRGTLVSITS